MRWPGKMRERRCGMEWMARAQLAPAGAGFFFALIFFGYCFLSKQKVMPVRRGQSFGNNNSAFSTSLPDHAGSKKLALSEYNRPPIKIKGLRIGQAFYKGIFKQIFSHLNYYNSISQFPAIQATS